jgi:hypothetical protein
VNVHLPIALLSLAIAIFLGTQIGGAYRASETACWQLANLEKQTEDLNAARKHLDELIQERAVLVQQSGQIQQQYNALLNDVLELAAADEDAKKVVQKWGIQRQRPPAAESAPEEAKPAPTP